MKTQNYPLVRLWDTMMGSNPGYSTEQVAKAARAGAPQTALSYTRKEHILPPERAGNPRLARWEDPDGGEWTLYNEYLPTETRLRLDNLCKQHHKMSLSELLRSLGYEERERSHANVHVTVGMEVDIEAWMTEYGVDREHALQQVRNDVTTAVKVVFLQDKWEGLVDGEVTVRFGMEA